MSSRTFNTSNSRILSIDLSLPEKVNKFRLVQFKSPGNAAPYLHRQLDIGDRAAPIPMLNREWLNTRVRRANASFANILASLESLSALPG
jgi:hypothetical protein